MNTSRQISSGLATLSAQSMGSGDPVVFLHAGVADKRMWHDQLEGVSAISRAIAYDRRGVGRTHAEPEDYSAVADLMAVIDALGNGAPVILVGCSQGGRIALDAALMHPAKFGGLILISPTITGSPEAVYPSEASELMAQQADAQKAGDLDLVNSIKAHLWLDGPLERAGRVTGPARQLFLEMNGIALRSPVVGADIDTAPVFDRLAEISVPTLVICGDLDFPHIQSRCRHLANTVPSGVHLSLTGSAHLPSLDQPAVLTEAIVEFVSANSLRRE